MKMQFVDKRTKKKGKDSEEDSGSFILPSSDLLLRGLRDTSEYQTERAGDNILYEDSDRFNCSTET